MNNSKSTHIDFTNKSTSGIPIFMNGVQIPYANTAKYLDMTQDAKLCWNEHVKIIIIELKLKWKKINWLLGRISKLSIEIKLLIYNQIKADINL